MRLRSALVARLQQATDGLPTCDVVGDGTRIAAGLDACVTQSVMVPLCVAMLHIRTLGPLSSEFRPKKIGWRGIGRRLRSVEASHLQRRSRRVRFPVSPRSLMLVRRLMNMVAGQQVRKPRQQASLVVAGTTFIHLLEGWDS